MTSYQIRAPRNNELLKKINVKIFHCFSWRYVLDLLVILLIPEKKRHRLHVVFHHCFTEISKSVDVEFPAEDKQTSTYPTYLDRAVGKSTTDPDQQADGSHCWRLIFIIL